MPCRHPTSGRCGWRPRAAGRSVAARGYAGRCPSGSHASEALSRRRFGAGCEYAAPACRPPPRKPQHARGRAQWARSTRCRRSRKVRDAAVTNPPAAVRSIDSAHCGLCGAKLSARALRYHVVSPQCCENDDGVPHVPQGGARRRVQAGRVAGGPAVHRQLAGLRRPMNRRRPASSPSTGAHGLPFATITVPVSPFHLPR